MKPFGSRTAKTAAPPQIGAQGDGAYQAPTPPQEELTEMSFLEHLEDLRWALIKGLGGVVVATIVCSFFSEWIIDVLLLGPKRLDWFMYDVLSITPKEFVLQNRTITGQFFAHLGTIVAVGVVIGSPIFVFSLWRFIEPGLYPNEKKGLRFSAVFATFFFMLGICFGYLIITPLALQFFSNYQISAEIANEFDINRY